MYKRTGQTTELATNQIKVKLDNMNKFKSAPIIPNTEPAINLRKRVLSSNFALPKNGIKSKIHIEKNMDIKAARIEKIKSLIPPPAVKTVKRKTETG
jgi:hypothetical protein